jgi:hypothetical protein
MFIRVLPWQDAAQAPLAVHAVVLGLLAQSQVAANVTQAVVAAKLFEAKLPSLLMPETVTVKQQLRPLPRTWGIDRCVLPFALVPVPVPSHGHACGAGFLAPGQPAWTSFGRATLTCPTE